MIKNEKKFCFIICVNDANYLDECIAYINRLIIPDGYEIDLLTIDDASSMASGYEEARIMTDAKYVIYIHQDTFIVNRTILSDLIDIFNRDKSIGAIGVLGSDSYSGSRIAKNGNIYGSVSTIGNIGNRIINKSQMIDIPIRKSKKMYDEVKIIFGFFIAAKIDFEWKEIFKGDWTYYSLGFCMEIRKKGYKCAVVNQEQPWCIHDGNNRGVGISKKVQKILESRYSNIFSLEEIKKRILICHSETQYETLEVALKRLGYTPEVYNERITQTQTDKGATDLLEEWLNSNNYICVMSYNFSPNIAEASYRTKNKYISWTWDAPLPSYNFIESKYDTNWTYVFDKTELTKLEKAQVKHVGYLPLATDVAFVDNISITDEDRQTYSNEISFIGQMYNETFLNQAFEKMHSKDADIIKEYCINHTCDWTENNKMFEIVYKDFMSNHHYKHKDREFYEKNWGINELQYDADYYISGFFRSLAHKERVKILNELAKKFKVDIYTYGNTDELKNINIHEPVNNYLIAPKIFRLSKININITTHNIRTGVPLRVFDIMGARGFVLSNYQEEMDELFVPDKEIVYFKTLDELMEKTQYYLAHEEKRQQIALNGYNRVKKDYNYQNIINRFIEDLSK